MYKIIILFFTLLLIGCVNTGMFLAANETNVELREANYNIVAANVTGESTAGYLIGFSYPIGAATSTLALVRVSGTGMLYREAIENLWQNYSEHYGEIKGRKLALVNVRYDVDTINLFVYTQARVSIRADVVEFTD
jgi:1-aminocyclopropane-1-carboxylate deaminase/D-cysteine desulfhydrase-like pyridoxal-dependent ACC family enzyme